MADVKKLLTEKLGPLPAWGWIGIGAAAWFFFFRSSSSAGTQAAASIPGVGGALASYIPNSSTGSGTTGTTLCGPGTILDPAGSGQCLPSPTGTTTTTPPITTQTTPTAPQIPYISPPAPVSQPVTVPAPFTPVSSLPPAQQAQLPAGSIGVSPQEQAYLNGGAAGEQAFLNQQSLGGVMNSLGSVSSNPSGYGGLSAASVQPQSPVAVQPAPTNCPPGSIALPGIGGPGQCVPIGLPVGAPIPTAQPVQAPVQTYNNGFTGPPGIPFGGSSSTNCPAGSRYLPGVGGPGLCVPYNTPIGAPV